MSITQPQVDACKLFKGFQELHIDACEPFKEFPNLKKDQLLSNDVVEITRPRKSLEALLTLIDHEKGTRLSLRNISVDKLIELIEFAHCVGRSQYLLQFILRCRIPHDCKAWK
jgi:hypothetical protein